MMVNSGRVNISESIANLVGEAWVHSITPINNLSSFNKSGIFPLNPSEVSDRMLAPSIVSYPPIYRHIDIFYAVTIKLPCLRRGIGKVMSCQTLSMSCGWRKNTLALTLTCWRHMSAAHPVMEKPKGTAPLSLISETSWNTLRENVPQMPNKEWIVYV